MANENRAEVEIVLDGETGSCARPSTRSAHFKAFAAEKYVPFVAQVAFEREVVRRLERIEDKLDAQAKAFTGVIAGVLDE